MTTKPKIGQRAIWEPTKDYGTVIAVSPNGDRVEIEWDHPDADSGETITAHLLGPHVSLTLCP